MESANTPDKLALLLKNSGISDAAIKIIKEHEISGEEFLALSQEGPWIFRPFVFLIIEN